MTCSTIIDTTPELTELKKSADYMNIHTVESAQSLREFTAASLSYKPGWMRFLYNVRKYFVRLLGTTQEDIPEATTLTPDELSFTPGDMATFFQVKAGDEDHFWLAEAKDDIISGHYGVICEPTDTDTNRFHIITTATYLKWTGRIYFTIICPFHHLVVNAMTRYAIRTYQNPTR